jgi:hypothetical protein
MKYAPIAYVLTAGAALAHGGHGEISANHWLAEGDHIVVVALTAGVVGFGLRALMGRRKGRAQRKS